MKIDGVVLKLNRVEEVLDSNRAARERAGELAEDLTIACGEGGLRLLEVQPAGGKVMSFKAYVNGRNVRPGMMCEVVSGG